MLNFEVPRERLEPFVPRGTELDDFQGLVLCSIVGFVFANTYVRGIRVPRHVDFEEVNLRFYVRRTEVVDGRPVTKRGVVFVKELVPRRAIAWIARNLYNEQYEARAMSHGIVSGANETRVRYAWRTDGG